MDFPTQHWTQIRTNNTIECLNCKIKRWTKAIGTFPDGQSILMRVCAMLCLMVANNQGKDVNMNIGHLFKAEDNLSFDIVVG